ncbi:MAG: CBS domain-containing protein [Nevskiales bacterium]|nr:CBS domain-containing protein [Nevskiales bacterium]
MQHPKQAKDVMTTDVVTVVASMRVAQAADLLLQRGVSSAPVVESDFTRQIVVGFLSERDLMECVASGQLHAQPEITVADVMRRHPLAVSPTTDLYTLAAVFMQHGFRHLPVVVAQTLQGVVSRRDVLDGLMQDYRQWLSQDPSLREVPDFAGIFAPRFLVE